MKKVTKQTVNAEKEARERVADLVFSRRNGAALAWKASVVEKKWLRKMGLNAMLTKKEMRSSWQK